MALSYRVLVNTLGLSREEWLKARKQGIGGSDVSLLCGESKYGNAITLWKDKLSDEVNLEMSEEAHFGLLLENLIASEFERRTGKKVRRRNAILQSIDYPFMIANLDRDIVGEESFLECVSTNAYQQSAWEDGKVPVDQWLQVQHYMAVLGYQYCYIATLIGNRSFVYTKVERDDELISYIIRLEDQFWNEHVLPKIEPDLDGSEFSTEYVKNKYPEADPKSRMTLDDKYIPLLEKREELAETIDRLKAEKDAIDNSIKNVMGEYEYANCGKFKIMWVNCKKNTFDKTKVSPEIYAAACKTTLYRRFDVN